MNTPESLKASPEKNNENAEKLKREGLEHRERIRDSLERSGERSQETNAETARAEALENAQALQHETLQSERQLSPAERRSGPISKAERDTSFNSTMKEVQSQMSPSSRVFSKAIHNKTVEKTSEVAASTIARPNALLSGSIFAFILTLGVYLIAKNIGYPLSGFESIAAFILGWVIGIAYDFVKTMITGRK